jgi:cell division protease FtsH
MFKWIRHCRPNAKMILAGLLATLIVTLVFQISRANPTPPVATGPIQIPIGQMIGMVRDGAITSIQVDAGSLFVSGRGEDDREYVTQREPGSSVREYLRSAGVAESAMPMIEVVGVPATSSGFPTGALLVMGLMFAATGIAYFLSRGNRQSQKGPRTPLARGGVSTQTQAYAPTRIPPQVSFDDIAGIDEVKEDLRELVLFLKEPERFKSLGARLPKGVLLTGAPGTGKTLLAKAVAGEAEVPFFNVNGSEFVEMYVGVGAARVRDLFENAKKSAPCVVFIDEIDAVGRRRGGAYNSNEERDQTLNQILVEMDGFGDGGGVVVMAATNRSDVLDQALLRPGRFDRQIKTDLPDQRGRMAILGVHARGKPLADDVDLEHLSYDTSGMSGAELENVMNESALLAARRNSSVIANQDVSEALERVIAGLAHKNRILRPEERQLVAVHEAGHALVAHVLPEIDPVRKISIVSRAGTGGYTRVAGEGDRRFWTGDQLQAQIAFALGGMVAEEIVRGARSTGASNDLTKANEIARGMVYKYGMGVSLGPIVISNEEGQPISPQLLDTAEQEVHRILDEAMETARGLVASRIEGLQLLVDELLRLDSLEGKPLEEALMAIPPMQDRVQASA